MSAVLLANAVVINRQSIKSYFDDPEHMAAFKKWLEERKAKEAEKDEVPEHTRL